LWQVKHGNTQNITIEAFPYPGTSSSTAGGQGPSIGQTDNEPLTITSPLEPFTKDDGSWFTGNDLIDLSKLGYSYAPGSYDKNHPNPVFAAPPRQVPTAAKGDTQLVHVHGVDRTQITGSFAITLHHINNGKREIIGVQPVLSRVNVQGCANCQNNLFSEAHFSVPTKGTIQTHTRAIKGAAIPHPGNDGSTHVEVAVVTRAGVHTQPYNVEIKSTAH